MSELIESYGMIGNLRTIALVSKKGSIDWMCLPKFDSPSCFTSLLGTPEHGRWSIAPEGEYRVTRRYRKDTLILETEFENEKGKCVVIDFMATEIKDEPVLIRIVKGISGKIKLKSDLTLRFDYGSVTPTFFEHPGRVFGVVAGPDAVRVKFPIPVSFQESKEIENATLFSEFEVEAKQELPFVLVWHPSHESPPTPEHIDPFRELQRTESFWTGWISCCKYSGKYEDEVRRSLITLKALTYEPTGGVVAAPTTSLPETLGGIRNWDYRYCWLRDGTYTLLALLQSGYGEETRAWKEYLLRAVAGTKQNVNIMYSIDGARRLTEIELDLPGYEGSRPVRTGNGAYDQKQLDAIGETMDLLYSSSKFGNPLSEAALKKARNSLNHLESIWHRPDQGIWEMRGEPRHYVHSKMMTWLAFDRGSKIARERGNIEYADHWQKIAQTIHQEICEKGFDKKKNSFVQFYGGENVDASLLTLALRGFLPIDDPRIKGTIEAVQRELTEDGFVYRYHIDQSDDGLAGKEAPFLFCNFWLVDCLALQGKFEEAEELFEKSLAVANDLGLLAEEYDLDTKRLLGNYPQAFSHIGVIVSAFMLSQAEATDTSDKDMQTMQKTSWKEGSNQELSM